jgi:hypothetical protein
MAIYDGNTVDLNVTRNAFGAISGLSKNEKSVGTGIENIYNKLPGSSVDPTTTNSLNQLVPDLLRLNNKDYAAVLELTLGGRAWTCRGGISVSSWTTMMRTRSWNVLRGSLARLRPLLHPNMSH